VRETEFTPNFKGILGSNRWSNAYSGFNRPWKKAEPKHKLGLSLGAHKKWWLIQIGKGASGPGHPLVLLAG